MDDEKSSIKLAPFTGKQTDWSVWKEKFIARARRKGYKETLLGKTEVPAELATLEVTDKTKIAARKANNTAYEDLLLLIDGEQASGRVAFNIVRGAKTTDLPDGDAALAWKRLSDKYEPKSAPSRLALKNEFTTKVLKNANSDPDAWLTELEDLRSRLIAAGSKMDDEELLEHVLNNLPKDYKHTGDYGWAHCPKFNLVGTEEIDNLTLAKMIAEAQGKELVYEMVDFHGSRPGHDLRYALDGGLLKSLGWEPKIKLSERIKEMTLWTLENKRWLK
jgi:hypothetical protein